MSRKERRALVHGVLVGSRKRDTAFLGDQRKRSKYPNKGRISVVFVVGGLPYGGIENFLLDLLVHLNSNKFDFKVVNLSGKGILTEKYLEKGFEVINMGLNLSIHRLDNTWRLRRLFRKLIPDVVFTVQFSANYHARLTAMGLGVKVITQIHNMKRERYWERRLADRLLGRMATTRFIAVSKKVQEALEKAVPASVGKTTLIYNAVSEKRLELPRGYSREAFRMQEGIRHNDFLVAAAARLVYQKGLDILIPAFQRVATVVPEARLLIAGDGEMFQQLKQMIESLSLAEKVRLLGYRPDVSSLLSACDLFVLPSRWEGFSIVALEAMALGVPMVLTETAPNSEAITHGETGWVVRCDPEDIAEGIMALYRNPDLRRKLAVQERALFQRDFSAESYGRKIEDVILEIAQS